MFENEEWEEVMAVAKSLVGGLPERNEFLLAEYNKRSAGYETNVNAVWHHWTGLYGPPCSVCGKLLRTPVATRCLECGAKRDAD